MRFMQIRCSLCTCNARFMQFLKWIYEYFMQIICKFYAGFIQIYAGFMQFCADSMQVLCKVMTFLCRFSSYAHLMLVLYILCKISSIFHSYFMHIFMQSIWKVGSCYVTCYITGGVLYHIFLLYNTLCWGVT